MRLFALILFAALGADVRQAAACTCARPADPCGAIERTSTVFVGRVVSLDTSVKFEVIESFKGVETKVIDVSTSGGAASCGFNFRQGQTYLVYAHESPSGSLTTSICTRTGEISARRHEVSVLRERKEGKTPTTRLFGHVTKRQLRVDGSLNADVIPLGKVPIRVESGAVARETTTDAAGAFLFTGLPPGTYSLSASLPELFERGRDRIEGIRLQCLTELPLGYARVPIQGTLARHDGTAANPWFQTVTAVAISGAQDAPLESRSTWTMVQGDGKWSFDGLPPGRYLVGVHAFKPSGQWNPLQQPFWYPNAERPSGATVVVVSDKGSQQHLDLRFPPPPEEMYFQGTIVGTDGRPIRGGVWLRDVDLGKVVSNASADYMGRFKVKAWRGHRYRLTGMSCGLDPKLQSQEMSLPDEPNAPLRVVLDTPCPPRR